MNTNKKTPKLRFKGFTDDWEQCKLKSIANTIVAGGDIDKNKIKESGTYPVIANALTKDGVVGYYEDTYRIEAPAVTVTGRGDIGVAKARHQNFTPVVRLLSLTTAHDVDFIENAINNLKIVSESTGVAQLTVPQLSNYKIHITSILEERKIGLFISKVDNLITLHQRKLEKLKLNKSALLQKLFPQKGCTIPDVRFKGFTDAWEQRKLGDVAIITGGGTPSTNVPEYWNGDIDWYSPVEIGKNRYVSKSTRKITKLGLEKSSAKLLPIGTVLFTSRAGIGNTAILQAEGCTNQGFQSITPDSKELDTYFLYTMTPRLKRYGEVTGAGSTFVEVSGKQMEKMSLVLPSLEEQKQIGRFFRTIDDSITLHQQEPFLCGNSVNGGVELC